MKRLSDLTAADAVVESFVPLVWSLVWPFVVPFMVFGIDGLCFRRLSCYLVQLQKGSLCTAAICGEGYRLSQPMVGQPGPSAEPSRGDLFTFTISIFTSLVQHKNEVEKMTVVDIHTHVYPPSFIALLQSRNSVPYIRSFPEQPNSHRLVILPGEDDPATPSTARGRPVGPDYWDIDKKIEFMDTHGIDISVISLANPWLDFVPSDEALKTAMKVNDDVEAQCAKYPGRLFGFGTLPLSGPVDGVVTEIRRLKGSKYMRGIIMGTSGLGRGLDDPALDPVYKALEETQTLMFLHPHYGLPGSVYGPRANDYGHVLPLALGFPLETTIAVTRMYLSGLWDRFPKFEALLAHSGGTLPFLAGRIESCVAHDAHLKKQGKIEGRRSVWDVLKKNIYLDAVIYADVGLKAAADASGADRIMLGKVFRCS